MQPRIMDKPAFTTVGMRIQTQPMSPEIPALWGKFGPRMDEISAVAEPMVSYGLMAMSADGSRLDYMAGMAVNSTDSLPSDMSVWEVPAATYAIFDSTLPALSETFGYIYNTWLPASDYQAAATPHLERYGESFDPGDPDSLVSIYIPLEKKA